MDSHEAVLDAEFATEDVTAGSGEAMELVADSILQLAADSTMVFESGEMIDEGSDSAHRRASSHDAADAAAGMGSEMSVHIRPTMPVPPRDDNPLPPLPLPVPAEPRSGAEVLTQSSLCTPTRSDVSEVDSCLRQVEERQTECFGLDADDEREEEVEQEEDIVGHDWQFDLLNKLCSSLPTETALELAKSLRRAECGRVRVAMLAQRLESASSILEMHLAKATGVCQPSAQQQTSAERMQLYDPAGRFRDSEAVDGRATIVHRLEHTSAKLENQLDRACAAVEERLRALEKSSCPDATSCAGRSVWRRRTDWSLAQAGLLISVVLVASLTVAHPDAYADVTTSDHKEQRPNASSLRHPSETFRAAGSTITTWLTASPHITRNHSSNSSSNSSGISSSNNCSASNSSHRRLPWLGKCPWDHRRPHWTHSPPVPQGSSQAAVVTAGEEIFSGTACIEKSGADGLPVPPEMQQKPQRQQTQQEELHASEQNSNHTQGRSFNMDGYVASDKEKIATAVQHMHQWHPQTRWRRLKHQQMEQMKQQQQPASSQTQQRLQQPLQPQLQQPITLRAATTLESSEDALATVQTAGRLGAAGETALAIEQQHQTQQLMQPRAQQQTRQQLQPGAAQTPGASLDMDADAAAEAAAFVANKPSVKQRTPQDSQADPSTCPQSSASLQCWVQRLRRLRLGFDARSMGLASADGEIYAATFLMIVVSMCSAYLVRRKPSPQKPMVPQYDARRTRCSFLPPPL